MKDRIRQIQEAQHMSQQIFADYLGIGSATLSSIYNGRTRPTLNVVESIKRKLPAINTDWLMFGTGKMFSDNVGGGQNVGGMDANRGADNASQDAVQALSDDLFGGRMADHPNQGGEDELLLSFEGPSEGVSTPLQRPSGGVRASQHPTAVAGQPMPNSAHVKAQQRPVAVERVVRHVTEIRVYYDDQTWESFTPSKSK